MPWLEVETKVKIKDVRDMRKRVRRIARFVKKEKKTDNYFALKINGYPKKAFRVRYNGKDYVINFKKWIKKYWSKDIVVKQEFEFNLNEKHLANFLTLLKDLDFKEWIRKIKYTESYKYKKNKRVTIEMNKVKHLGWFLEVEYLCQKKEMKKAKEKIREVLKGLEVKQEDIDNTGYTKMLWEKGRSLRKK